MAVVPLVGGTFAAWVTGRIRSGVGAGFVGATLALLIFVAYFASYEQLQRTLVGYTITTPIASTLAGIPAGFLGGLLGVGLHNVRWWAKSDA